MRVTWFMKFVARLCLFLGIGEISDRRTKREERIERRWYHDNPWLKYGLTARDWLSMMNKEAAKLKLEKKKEEEVKQFRQNVAELVQLLKKKQ